MHGLETQRKQQSGYQELTKQAFFGTGTIWIIEHETSPKFNLGTYNKGWEIQESFLRYLAGEMSRGHCENLSYPLIAAICSSAVEPGRLIKDHRGTSSPKTVWHLPSALDHPIEILAGRHRVEASQRASKVLKERVNTLQKRIDSLQPASNSGAKKKVDGCQLIDQESIDVMEAEVEKVESLVQCIETWLVNFYDIGTHSPRLSMGTLTVIFAQRYAEGARKNSPKEGPGRAGRSPPISFTE